jgi:phosphatidylserine decarboxylase
MKHAGKARQAGLKIIFLSFGIAVVLIVLGSLWAGRILNGVTLAVAGLWVVFFVFSLSFFRDPEPRVPADAKAIVSPGHGTVDVIDETVEKAFMGGPCRRVSIFLSVFDVHVQNAPVSGKVSYLEHRPGRFVNAMRRDCGNDNENVLLGIESNEAAGEKVGVRLIAGLLARRIVPWVARGDVVAKGERTSLIQFGSRVDLYLPMSARVTVELGAKVKGGETVVALRG